MDRSSLGFYNKTILPALLLMRYIGRSGHYSYWEDCFTAKFDSSRMSQDHQANGSQRHVPEMPCCYLIGLSEMHLRGRKFVDTDKLHEEMALTNVFSTVEINNLLDHLEHEIPSFHSVVLGLFKEFNEISRLYKLVDYEFEGRAKYPEVIFAAIAPRQYELCVSATRAFGTCQYITCATLIRSVFEGNMVCLYLSHNPNASSDFLAFSEVCGRPDIDWARYGFSKTRIKKLEKKFGIRSMIRELYAGNDDLDNRISIAGFYQDLCNITHPNLEPSALFYKPCQPPVAAYSSIGLRRTATQLFSVLNVVAENVSNALLKDRHELDASYQRRSELHRFHTDATMWHARNPNSQPAFDRNKNFKVAIASGSAYLLGYPENEEQRNAAIVRIPD